MVSSNVPYVDGIYEFTPDIVSASIRFRFANNTSSPVTVDIAYSPQPPPAGWQIFPPLPASLDNVTINARSDVKLTFDLLRPPAHGSILELGLHVTLHDTATVVGDAGIRIRAAAP